MGNIVSKIKGLRMGKKDSVLETLSSFQKLEEPALYYHEYPKPGKLEIQATKPLGNQRDLALAYSPGVAAPCLAIHKDPHADANYTARSNLVGVISNGSAVLGLGDIGPLAAKPVMEGKAVLFKKFAGIDVFDIEINEHEISKIVETIAALEPTFGGINLEDIKAAGVEGHVPLGGASSQTTLAALRTQPMCYGVRSSDVIDGGVGRGERRNTKCVVQHVVS